MTYPASVISQLNSVVWPDLEAAYDLPPGILHALAWWETRGRFDNRTSPAGAQGLFQFMPIAIEQVRRDAGFVLDPDDPYESSHAAAVLMRRLLRRFNGSIMLATAAYNAGEGRISRYLREVRQHGKALLPRETVDYVIGVNNILGYA